MESLGVTLKKLREEKGLTVKDISGITKIREPLILALEAEQWEKLPEKIFIRGFVHSYVRAIDGDESLFLDMFESACPGEEGEIVFPDYQKKTFKGLERKPLKRLWIIIVFLFLIGAGGWLVYYFLGSTQEVGLIEKTSEIRDTPSEVTEDVPDAGQKARETQNVEVKEEEVSEQTAFSEQTRGKKSSRKKSSTMEHGSPVIQTESDRKTPTPGRKLAAPPEPAGQAKQINEEKKKEIFPELPPEETAEPAEKLKNLVIKAKMETWLSLKIDGKPHKEILLKPGERFEARVVKTADLLIGNAGGVNIEFNGKDLTPDGKSGQVVRLKLPFEKN